jgi:hypothetical protein
MRRRVIARHAWKNPASALRNFNMATRLNRKILFFP